MGDDNNNQRNRPAATRIAVALVVLISATVLGYWLLGRIGTSVPVGQPESGLNQDSMTAVSGVVEPSETVVPAESGSVLADTSTCNLTELDVKNVPKGWGPLVFDELCIGFAFPAAEDVESGVYVSPDEQQMIVVRDNTDIIKAEKILYLIAVNSSLYESSPDACVRYAYGSFAFCRGKIVEEWRKEERGDYVEYFPTGGDVPETPLASRAAVMKAGGGFFLALEYTGKKDEGNGEIIDRIMKTLVIGNPDTASEKQNVE